MDWYVVDKKYINYLTQFDSRVGYVEYGERLKLHVGILLTIGDFHYYVPISSAKPKHQKMSNSLDFHKLQDESTGYLYAVLNINNMIPVPDNCLTQLKYNQVESFRSFILMLYQEAVLQLPTSFINSFILIIAQLPGYVAAENGIS